MNNLQHKTFKDYLSDVGIYGFVHLLFPLAGIITLTVITKLLGIDAYGIYSLAITTIGILVYFVHLMVPSGLIRFLAGESDRRVISSTFLSTMVLIILCGTLVAIIMLSFSGKLATTIFHDADARVYIYVIVAAVFFEAARLTLYAYFRILEQVKRYLKYEVAFEIIRIGLIVAAVYAGGDVLYVLLAVLFSSLINSLALLLILLREQGYTAPKLRILKPYLVFGVPLIVPQLMAWVISLSDRYFISYFWGAKEVGIYSAAYALPVFVAGINEAIWFVILPVVFKLWNAGAYDDVKVYFTRAVKIFAMFGLPATFGIIMLANPALSILSTPEVGMASWQVVPFICVSSIAYAVYGYGADIYLVQRKTKYVAYFVAGAALINTIGNILLIPEYGILGAAIATLIAYVAMAAVAMGMASRLFTFPVDFTFIGKSLAASVVMAVFLWFFRPVQLWEVILGICLGAAIYFIVLFLMKGFKKEEIDYIKRFLAIKR